MAISRRILSFIALFVAASQVFAFNLKQGHPVFQVGGFVSNQGQTQNIGIQDLIGDIYTVTDHQDHNALVGFGYLLDGPETKILSMAYGINAFYLAQTSVKGNIIQEHLFTNLSYRYDVAHLPIYLTAKAAFNNISDKYAITLDAGIGPNFIKTKNVDESSLDGGITLPDNAFSGETTTVLSAMVGIGFKINNVFCHVPLELGYRFFYLGEGNFQRNTNQLLNTLKTGNNYAQALIISVAV